MRRCCFGKENVYGRGAALGFRDVGHVSATVPYDSSAALGFRVVGHACSNVVPYNSSAVLGFRRERAPPYRLLQRPTIQKPSGFPDTIHHSPFTIHRVHILCGVALFGSSDTRVGNRPLQFLCGIAFSARASSALPIAPTPYNPKAVRLSRHHSPFTIHHSPRSHPLRCWDFGSSDTRVGADPYDSSAALFRDVEHACSNVVPYNSSAALRFRRERAPPYRLLQRPTIQKPSGFPFTVNR